jgi:Trypsin-like serine proteases, typically periplasmic, contain C-terminal PDZ domain
MRKYLLFLIAALLSAGCVISDPNRFEENYRPYGISGVPGDTCLVPRKEALPAGDLDRIKYDLWTRGYETVGFSSFKGHYRVRYEDDAMEYGRTIGACLVLFGYAQTHVIHDTELETRRIETRTKGSKKTQVTEITERVPVTTDGYTFTAVYAIKTSPNELGPLYAAKLPDDIMRKLDSREGNMVVAVIEGSPAWHANIFPGDVILSRKAENGGPWLIGKTVVTRIYRDGKTFTRKIPWKNTTSHEESLVPGP